MENKFNDIYNSIKKILDENKDRRKAAIEEGNIYILAKQERKIYNSIITIFGKYYRMKSNDEDMIIYLIKECSDFMEYTFNKNSNIPIEFIELIINIEKGYKIIKV